MNRLTREKKVKRKTMWTIAAASTVLCTTVLAASASGLTGPHGDVNDPNNQFVAMAAAQAKSINLPAPAAVLPTPSHPIRLTQAQRVTASNNPPPSASSSIPAQEELFAPVAKTNPTPRSVAATQPLAESHLFAQVTPPASTPSASIPADPNSGVTAPINANSVNTNPTAVSPTTTASNVVVPPVIPSDANAAEPNDADPTPTPTVSAAEKTAASPNAFGTTSNGRTAFAQMVRNLMPLTPTQIVTLRDMFDQTQRAVSQYPGIPPKPTSSSILVNMSPGAAPPVIRLRAGYVTSLVFLDSTGQPWPVVGYDLGNPKAFNIQPSAPNGKSDTLILQAVDRYEQGNLAVMLKDENTPVMLTLMPGQRAVDYRVDLRIPGLGPNASVSMSGLPATESPVLMNFLDGVAPSGAKLLTVHGAPAQAWLYRHHLYLRTRVTVLSPGWISSMNSPDGTHVYELAKTPIILASQRGEMVQLTVKGL